MPTCCAHRSEYFFSYACGWNVAFVDGRNDHVYQPVSRETLAALVGVQTFSTGSAVTVDARVAGLAAAIVALALRAPFLVVILVAAATAAVLRGAGLAP